MPHAALYGVGPERAFFNVIHEFDVDGRESRGNMLQRACKEYSIDLEWRPVKTPHYGAHSAATHYR